MRLFLSVLLFSCWWSAGYCQHDTIFFDSKWKRIKRDSAVYYRPIVSKIVNGRFRVIDYHINHTPQMIGYYKNIPPLDEALDAKQRDGVFKYYRKDGILESETEYKDGKKTGVWKTYFTDSTGRLSMTQIFKNGLQEGTTLMYDSLTGAVIARMEFKNGMKDGDYTLYYPDGRIYVTDKYKKGKQCGLMTVYDSTTGYIYSTAQFKKGMQDGEARVNFPKSDKLWKTEFYKKGKREGISVHYDSAGFMTMKAEYKSDSETGTWVYYYSQCNKVKSILNVKNGKPEGENIYFDSLSGLPVIIYKYENGKLNGLCKKYYAGTQKISETGNYKNGRRQGSTKLFDFKTGQVLGTWNYDKGLKEGEAITYDVNQKRTSSLSYYKQDRREGLYTLYSHSGYPIFECNYKEGYLDGKSKYYHYGGNLWMELNYANDQLEGEQVVYHISGVVKRRDVYQDGQPVSGQCYDLDGNQIAYTPLLVEPVFLKNKSLFLYENIRYPEKAKMADVHGSVLLRFAVSTSGKTNDIEVYKGLGYGCDEEAIRLVHLMVPWTPANIDEHPFETYHSVTIDF